MIKLTIVPVQDKLVATIGADALTVKINSNGPVRPDITYPITKVVII
jgi:hypothetical protein